MTKLPIVTAIMLDAGSNARPLVLLAHALHHLDGDRAAAVALVEDLTDGLDSEPPPGTNSRFPV